jgi:hypothetical protein
MKNRRGPALPDHAESSTKGKGKQPELVLPIRDGPSKSRQWPSFGTIGGNPDGDNLKTIHMDISDATDRVALKKLNFHRTQGVLNKYSVKSLVANDFKRVDANDFVARAVCVANTIGTDKMIKRLTTDPRFRISGATSLQEWWVRASTDQKLLSLTNAKDFDKSSVSARLERIHQVGFPFQEAGLDSVADEESGYDS